MSKKYKNLTGLWKGKFGYSFKVTDQFKEVVAALPVGVYVNVWDNKNKSEDNHPDKQLVAKLPDGDQDFLDDEW